MEDKKRCGDCGCKPIKGIKCNVENCHYHSGQTDCLAGEIAVGPHDAGNSDETLCVTFKRKEF